MQLLLLRPVVQAVTVVHGLAAGKGGKVLALDPELLGGKVGALVGTADGAQLETESAPTDDKVAGLD